MNTQGHATLSHRGIGRRRFGLWSASLAVALLVASPAGAADLPKDSLYRLDMALTDQDAKTATLASRRGQVRLVSMFYTSCKFACPLIINALQRTEKALSDAERARLGVLLVSFDPARDTPQAMKTVAGERNIDLSRWSLTRTEVPNVRKFAAALGVQYRPLSNGEVSHSNVLALLDADGRILAKTEKLNAVDPDFVAAVRRALAPAKK